MNGHNVVAVYNLREDAERVRDRLIAFGIPATDIRLSSASENAGAASLTEVPHERHHGFWDWLFGKSRTRARPRLVSYQFAGGEDGVLSPRPQ